jgi:transketolase N-terminal domain/subunit
MCPSPFAPFCGLSVCQNDKRAIMISREKHDRMANAIRFLSMDAVEKANSGHPGLPMGAADIATVLFTRFLSL